MLKSYFQQTHKRAVPEVKVLSAYEFQHPTRYKGKGYDHIIRQTWWTAGS